MRRSQEFSLVLRRGRRAGRARLVVHLLRQDSSGEARDPAGPHASGGAVPTRDSGDPTRVGFVVSKAVGNAVVRHRVARRLRHLMRERLPLVPAGTLVVVRALPPAASATSDELGRDVDSALRKFGVSAPAERRDADQAGDGPSVDEPNHRPRSGDCSTGVV